MDTYTPIADHGLIGDLQTSALVTSDASITWFCSPRYDSPSLFAGLLDRQRGGFFQIRPDASDFVTKHLYLPGTAVLITRFLTPDGVGEVYDFMPVLGAEATDRHQIVRMLRVVRGQMRFVMECEPRFDYGRVAHRTEISEQGAVFRTDDLAVSLHVVGRPGAPRGVVTLDPVGDTGVRGTVAGREGDVAGVVLETACSTARMIPGEEIAESFVQTRDFWRGWVARSQYSGRWREAVERSAITLKLMTYRPTGALVAAPTAGLPEQVGGERNWDYRYTWVRDSSFSVHALLGLGYTEEAEAFLSWLGARVDEAALAAGAGQPSPLKIMYRVDGSSDLEEAELDHFEGWRESRPVRIGNGASDQLQLDVYGEALDSLWRGDRAGLPLPHGGWLRMRSLVDWLCDNWDRPDDGIWETRGGRQEFTYGRLMSWVAFDRAIRLADEHGRPADLTRWHRARDAVYDAIMTKGWNAERGAFVQHAGTSVLDAALLYMPLVGFIAPTDPMWLSTLRAMDEELVSDSLVYRYNPTASPDGLRGSEGTFSMCTFWYVEALARAGRLSEARLTFEKMLTYGNNLGLYSEEIGPTGEQLGNFPQAFSHLALIRAAMTLDTALDEPTTDGHTGLSAAMLVQAARAGAR